MRGNSSVQFPSASLKDLKKVRCGSIGVGALMSIGPVVNSSPRALPKVSTEVSFDLTCSSVMMMDSLNEKDGDTAGRG